MKAREQVVLELVRALEQAQEQVLVQAKEQARALGLLRAQVLELGQE